MDDVEGRRQWIGAAVAHSYFDVRRVVDFRKTAASTPLASVPRALATAVGRAGHAPAHTLICEALIARLVCAPALRWLAIALVAGVAPCDGRRDWTLDRWARAFIAGAVPASAAPRRRLSGAPPVDYGVLLWQAASNGSERGCGLLSSPARRMEPR